MPVLVAQPSRGREPVPAHVYEVLRLARGADVVDDHVVHRSRQLLLAEQLPRRAAGGGRDIGRVHGER
ncbi:MAG: hypothetical protein ACRD0G_14245, partial [Acidimicrobiales bacterium]